MYLKRIDGPRAVTLPDGSVMTRADLPAADTSRWVARRKAAVVRAVLSGLISRDEARARYALSDEELDGWIRAAGEAGLDGLRVTRPRRKQP